MKRLHGLLPALVLTMVLAALISGCPGILPMDFNNPKDPKSSEYQGFHTVVGVDEVLAYTPDGAVLYFLEFTVSEVQEGDAYRLQIARDRSFGEILYDGNAFATNVMEPLASLDAGESYYWRGAAHKGGVWGPWTEVRGFATGVITGLSPANGSSTLDTTPTLSWDAVDGAARYEVQIADNAAAVAGTTAKTVTAPAHTYSPATALTIDKTYYWRVRALDSAGQTGVWSSIFSLSIRDYIIGSAGPAGGIVFYDKGSVSDGWRFLEAAPSDQGTYFEWGGYGTSVGGGTSTAIGTGKANTEAIVNKLGSGSYAARICYDLVLGGYDDWFLPSRDELNELYKQRSTVGGFASYYYWSSSEANSGDAWGQNFDNGFQYYDSKSDDTHVRSVRAF